MPTTWNAQVRKAIRNRSRAIGEIVAAPLNCLFRLLQGRPMSDFDAVWQRIRNHEGEQFRQVRGNPFDYRLTERTLRPSTTNQAIARSHFQRAWERRPLKGPGQLQDLRGPSYLYAVLSDQRISGSAAN
jgi:hypothetical protein